LGDSPQLWAAMPSEWGGRGAAKSRKETHQANGFKRAHRHRGRLGSPNGERNCSLLDRQGTLSTGTRSKTGRGEGEDQNKGRGKKIGGKLYGHLGDLRKTKNYQGVRKNH